VEDVVEATYEPSKRMSFAVPGNRRCHSAVRRAARQDSRIDAIGMSCRVKEADNVRESPLAIE
jgi:hypothetical protein